MAPQPLDSPHEAAAWLRARVQGRLRIDSRQVRPGDGFIAWPGAATDGRRYVAAALQAGAQACLVESEGVEAFDFGSQPRIAALKDLKAGCGVLADDWFGAPSADLDVVAVTGTNGKTSIAWWTAQAMTALGQRCGIVGTLGVGEPPTGYCEVSGEVSSELSSLVPTGLTTPDPVTLQAAFQEFRADGFKACAIEASSIGLSEQRLAGTRIAVAQFSNLTRDHLDYHGDMAAYWQAKRALFAWPGLRAAVVNVDDPAGASLAGELASAGAATAGGLDLWTCSVQSPARLQARALQYRDAGLRFEVSDGGPWLAVATRMIGDYNASNLLVVLATLRALHWPLAEAVAVVSRLTAVPGRMQRVAGEAPAVVVDFAHTPDALEKALAALRPLAQARGGRLWCVFGCGGNRDTSKRPLMGAIAAKGADRVLLTSDNPRQEDPAAIVAQIASAATAAHVTVQLDRSLAIAQAVQQAQARDVVLIAGKGHEDYQETAGLRQPFSDVDHAQRALRQREAAQ